ncbi:TMhelix containing protein [Vibrio phage P23]|nr:TMhelix containing protein [Vibrio phage P23]
MKNLLVTMCILLGTLIGSVGVDVFIGDDESYRYEAAVIVGLVIYGAFCLSDLFWDFICVVVKFARYKLNNRN